MAPLGLEVLVACALGALVQRAWPGPAQAGTRAWLFAAISAGVIAYWQLPSLVLTLALTGFVWLVIRVACAVGPSRQRKVVALGVLALVAVLAGFQYARWLIPWLRPGGTGAPDQWFVPLGLSFTIFRLIGVLFDGVALGSRVSGGQLVFLSLFFPIYRAGPIETLRSVAPLSSSGPGEGSTGWACARMFQGLCRKVLLADPLHALLIAPWLAQGVENLSPAQCLLLPILFSFRIYWDFAGYTDIAVGAAALVGYRVRENFDRPYLSRNLVEFWNRWHITLSEWIRLRVFMKMIDRRSPKWRFYVAMVASMALCGLWHGAGLNFLVWGLWHGVGLVCVHLFRNARSAVAGRPDTLPGAAAVSTCLTFAYVSLGWLMFFLPLDSAWLLASRALSWRPGEGVYGWAPVVTVVAVLMMGAITARLRPGWSRLPALVRHGAVSAAAAALVYVLVVRHAGFQEFIYAQF